MAAVTVASVALSLSIVVPTNLVVRHHLPTDIVFIAVLVPLLAGITFGTINFHLFFALVRAQERLELLSTTDELTQVANRRRFLEQASSEWLRHDRYGQTFSLLMLDVDDFKVINDTHGHAAGDAVLRTLAQVCHGRCRKTDLFARFGGEEFVLLLPETPAQGAVLLAERLRAALAEAAVQVSGNSVSMTVSIGVSQCQEGDSSLDTVLRRADDALYRAKRQGKNRVLLQ